MTSRGLVAFYREHFKVEVNREVLQALSDIATDRLIPKLWLASQSEQTAGRFVSHRSMERALEKHFPQELLTNGDVVLLPETTRLIVTEPMQDFFRDTGLHWAWIGMAIQRAKPAPHPPLKELDPYAAEMLSEFVSVIGIAVVQLAAKRNPIPALNESAIKAAYEIISSSPQNVARPEEAGPEDGRNVPAFSAAKKKHILASLPKPMFTDVTKELGIDFVHRPEELIRYRRTGAISTFGIAGGGVAAGDFDDDAYPDVFVAGGGGGRLYHNVRGKSFDDVTEDLGLALQGESRAAYFIDYDNDGDQDLFITFVAASNRLFEQRDGRFVDVTEAVGLSPKRGVSHEAVWFDMDNDGLLDIYIAQFGAWPLGVFPTLGRNNTNGFANLLYRHSLKGDRHLFEEIADQAGVADTGWTHCVGAWDYDGDGRLDIFSLNDYGASKVYRNLGNGRFAEESNSLHLDTAYHAMNFTLMDIDQSGRFAIYVTEITPLMHRQRYRLPTEYTPIKFTEESLENLRILTNNKLYHDAGNSVFKDVHGQLFEPTLLGWAWDASALDYENDGDPDMLVLNGTEKESNTERKSFVHKFSMTPNVFFLSEGGYFYDVSEQSPLAFVGNSRGSAFADFDRDGDLDVIVSNYDAPTRIFRNEQESHHQWVELRLQGTHSNRDAIGTRIHLRSGKLDQHAVVVSGSGFLSQDPKTLHFGVGAWNKTVSAQITWPSGIVQTIDKLTLNRRHTIVEPNP